MGKCFSFVHGTWSDVLHVMVSFSHSNFHAAISVSLLNTLSDTFYKKLVPAVQFLWRCKQSGSKRVNWNNFTVKELTANDTLTMLPWLCLLLLESTLFGTTAFAVAETNKQTRTLTGLPFMLSQPLKDNYSLIMSYHVTTMTAWQVYNFHGWFNWHSHQTGRTERIKMLFISCCQS